MSRHRTILTILHGIIWLLIVSVVQATGYELDTHAAISAQAVQGSTADQVLKESLAFTEGAGEIFNGRSAIDWIAEGSRREDALLPTPRFLRHFHNPLRPWSEAGFGLFQSSILWGQNLEQDWSWSQVRRYYYDALTSSTRTERERAFAKTFRGLGHLIHLVQDAASPAHTRNDPHAGFNYENLVLAVQQTEAGVFQGFLTNPQKPDPGWQTLPSDPLAPIPIARVIDTDRYDRTNPGVTTQALIGLSEYTNANFFSEDTTFNQNLVPPANFPFPARTSVQVGTHQIELRKDDGTREVVNRLYYDKVADGDVGYRLATVGFLRDYIQRFNLDPNRLDERPALDESVYRDYAAKLLPRAVGYSAALLDYFFRGRLEVDVVANAINSAQLEVRVINRSSETIGGPGTLSIHCDTANGTRTELPGKVTLTEPVLKDAELPRVPFAPPAGTERCMAVFAGRLGNEVPVSNLADPTRDFPGAVIGKVFAHPAEVVFIGTVNGINGFYLASDKGLFRIQVRDQPTSFFRLDSISWGVNDNILLVVYDPTTDPLAGNVFQIHKINRAKGSSAVPTKTIPDPETGLELVDTTVLAEFVERPNFPIPGTMTTEVTSTAHRRLVGVTGDNRAGNISTGTNFAPLAEDTVGPFLFSASTDMNLNNSLMVQPNALFASPIHAFVDGNDELIVLHEIRWRPQELVRGQVREVPAYGIAVPGVPASPNTFCSQLRFSEVRLTGAQGSLSQLLSPSATLVCKALLAPGFANIVLKDYVLVNQSTGQILAKSFDNPTFRWEERGEVLSNFSVGLTTGTDLQGNTLDIAVVLRFGRNFGVRDVNNDVVTVVPTWSGIFNFTTSGRGFFGITVEPPFIHTPFQENVPGANGIDNFFTRFTTRTNPEERELDANEEEFDRQFFPLQNRGGLILLAKGFETPSFTYQVVRLPLPAQAGDPVVAKILTGKVTPLPGQFRFRNRTLIEAHQTAVLATFRSNIFPRPVERAFFITGANDTVREILPADFPEDLRIVTPNAFINDFDGKRKEQTPVFTNGTVAFIQNATPEKDFLVPSTFPNVNTLEVKSFEHKPQWHQVLGGR